MLGQYPKYIFERGWVMKGGVTLGSGDLYAAD